MRLSRLAVFLLIAGLSPTGSLLAQAPGMLQVDTEKSRVYARVDAATRLGHNHGIVGNLAAGRVTLGGAGDLAFDMSSFVADTAEARQRVGLDANFSASDAKKVNENMRGSDVLDVARFPRAVYKIASMRPLDGQAAGAPGRYMVSGTFTLHGVSQQAPFEATVAATQQPGVFRMSGEFTIRQTSYNMQPYSAMGGLVKISDEMKIWGDLVLVLPGR
jgi:polyisoprenoid-binding protein YceI